MNAQGLDYSNKSNQVNDIFLISKDFSLNENEELEFLNFYDVGKKTNYTLSIKDEKIYMCCKLDLFGSVFYGNYVYEEPTTLIIKEVDPTLFMINIMYNSSGLSDGKFSPLDLKGILTKYKEELENSHYVEDSDIESSFKFLRFLFEDNSISNLVDIDKICEKQHGNLSFNL